MKQNHYKTIHNDCPNTIGIRTRVIPPPSIAMPSANMVPLPTIA